MNTVNKGATYRRTFISSIFIVMPLVCATSLDFAATLAGTKADLAQVTLHDRLIASAVSIACINPVQSPEWADRRTGRQ
jgi:hypothetical protein